MKSLDSDLRNNPRDFGQYSNSEVKRLIFPIPCQWALAREY